MASGFLDSGCRPLQAARYCPESASGSRLELRLAQLTPSMRAKELTFRAAHLPAQRSARYCRGTRHSPLARARFSAERVDSGHDEQQHLGASACRQKLQHQVSIARLRRLAAAPSRSSRLRAMSMPKRIRAPRGRAGPWSYAGRKAATWQKNRSWPGCPALARSRMLPGEPGPALPPGSPESRWRDD